MVIAPHYGSPIYGNIGAATGWISPLSGRTSSCQPDRDGGEIAKSVACPQRRFCPSLRRTTPLAWPAQATRPEQPHELSTV